MNPGSKPTPEFYTTGGTIKPGSESYIVRHADEELFQALRNGEFCYVLTTRQMGKSSLMARTADRLAEAGFRSAQVDLTLIGADERSMTSGQWYFGVAHRILRELKISAPLPSWWQEREQMPAVQRFTEFLETLVLGQCSDRIVIFVDEIDSTIGLSFSDDFFAAVRACYNLRPRNPAFERLSCVLLGVATPAQLISDPARTPFNIGRGIELTDFTPAEAQVLGKGFCSQNRAEELLNRVLYWTGGHPYLTQALCRTVAETEERPDGAAQDGTALVDRLVREKFFSPMATLEEKNLKFVRGRLRQGYSDLRKLLGLYSKVLRGDSVRDQPASPLYASLKLAGVVKADHQGLLKVRNRIYEHVFDRRWVRREMPANVARLITAAVVVFVALILGFEYFLLERGAKPYVQNLRSVPTDDEIAYTAYRSLQNNFLYRHQATLLFANFWEGREDRDRALFSLLRGLNERDDVLCRRYAADLIGQDYGGLLGTVRYGQVKATAFSPDGTKILTGDSDGIVQLWNMETGKPVGVPMKHENSVVALAFRPDGKVIATGSWDNTARLWNAETGEPVGVPMKHENFVVSLAFRPDGKVIATGGWDNTVRFWQADTGKPVGFPLKLEDSADVVAFSPDGRVIATVYNGATWRLWRADTGKPIGLAIKQEGTINAIAFSPDSGVFATASDDNSARLWNTNTGKPVGVPMKHDFAVDAVVFSPDGRIVATGSRDRTARLWRADSGEPAGAPLWHPNSVFALAFSVDGKTLLTGGVEGARLWNVETGALLRSPLRHDGFVTTVSFSSDAKKLLTGSRDGTARLWRIDAGIPLLAPRHEWTDVADDDLSPDGKKVIAIRNGEARLWSAETGQPIGPVLRHDGKVGVVAYSSDGKLLATGSEDHTARLWRADTGEPVGAPMQHRDTVWLIAFLRNSNIIMTGSKDGTARVWNTATGSPLGPFLEHGAAVSAIHFERSRHLAITGGADGVAQLWQADTGKKLRAFQEPAAITAAVLSPGGEFALTATNAGTANLWRTDNGTQIGSLRYKSPVRASFSGDGKTIGFGTTGWYFVRSWNGQLFQLLGAGLWRGFGIEWFSSARDGTHWELRSVSAKGFQTVPAGKPISSPLAGNAKALMDDWERRLGLTADPEGRIVPKYSPPVPGVPVNGTQTNTRKATPPKQR
jgi:WD40 repeat protein